MKRLIFILALLLVCSFAFAHTEEEKEKKKVNSAGVCKVTNIRGDIDDCMDCHKLIRKDDKIVFGLKQLPRTNQYDFPVRDMNVVDNIGYYRIGSITVDETEKVEKALNYFAELGFETVELEILSPGGSLFAGWRIVSLMQEKIAGGMIIRTTCRGFSASAAFLIFVGGSKGHRVAAETSEFMFHEVATYKMGLFRDTPSKLEDQAEVLRHLQDTGSAWLADRCNLTKKEIDEKIDKTEYWLNGKQMVEMGFADKLMY